MAFFSTLFSSLYRPIGQESFLSRWWLFLVACGRCLYDICCFSRVWVLLGLWKPFCGWSLWNLVFVSLGVCWFIPGLQWLEDAHAWFLTSLCACVGFLVWFGADGFVVLWWRVLASFSLSPPNFPLLGVWCGAYGMCWGLVLMLTMAFGLAPYAMAMDWVFWLPTMHLVSVGFSEEFWLQNWPLFVPIQCNRKA